MTSGKREASAAHAELRVSIGGECVDGVPLQGGRHLDRLAAEVFLLDQRPHREVETIALLVEKFVEDRHVAKLGRPFGEPVKKAGIAG